MSPLIPIERFEVFATGLDHPECLAFDRDGMLWAGGEAGQIYRIDPAGKVEQITTLGTFNAGLAFSPEGELFVCNPAQGIVRVRRDGTHETFATHAGSHRIVCSNYIVFTRRGDFYVTDSGQWMKQNGALIRYSPDRRGDVVAGPFGYANGLALSGDGRTLYMVESNTNRVFRFALNDDGGVASQTIFAENVGRMPDGLALDPAGNVLASCYASDDIHRISTDGRVELFARDPWAILLSRPTNMCWGDEDRSMLYVANLGRYTIVRARMDFAGSQ